MKFRSKIKILLSSSVAKIVIFMTVVTVLLTAIILPSILNARPKGSVLAFNRNSASGTAEAFAKKVLDKDLNTFSPSKLNVREVSTNDAMIRSVALNKNSIGYVSFGTIAKFDKEGNPELQKKYKGLINFTKFNGISATLKNISSNEKKKDHYKPSRNFNSFLRVAKGSDQAEIMNYKWGIKSNKSLKKIKSLSNELKMTFLFNSWILKSTQAKDLLVNNSEIPFTDDKNPRIDFNKRVVKNYIDWSQINKGKNTIEIVGSSSAETDLSLFKEEFIKESKVWGFDTPDFKQNTIGSAIAFKKTIPGMQTPFLGLQSREATKNELASWGWDKKNKKPYNAFAKDAILIIYNTKGFQKVVNQNHFNVTGKSMQNLYCNQTYYYYSNILIIPKRGKND